MNKILLFVKMHKTTERNINVKFSILWKKNMYSYDKVWRAFNIVLACVMIECAGKGEKNI